MDNAYSGPSRMGAKAVLEDRIKRSIKETDILKTLLVVTPWNALTKEEEENLWSYFCRSAH